MRLSDARPVRPRKPSLAESIRAHKALWTIAGTALVLALIIADSLLLSGKVVRLACARVPAEWQESLPCPAATAPAGDPRRVLYTQMGIAWGEPEFWAAVRRGDDEATELFLRGGMTVSASQLHEVLSDGKTVRKAALAPLLANSASRSGEFCSWDKGGIARLVGYAKDDVAARFVRSFCGDQTIAEALGGALRAEVERASELERANARNQRDAGRCIDDLLRRVGEGEDILRPCPVRASMTDVERELCVFQHPIKALFDARGSFAGTLDYEPGIRHSCAKNYPVRKVDRTRESELKAALAVFSK